MVSTVYLVSGANRGIGLGLVTTLAARPNVIIFAGARTPASATNLKALEAKYPGKVHTVKLTSADKADNQAAVEEIKRVAGKLDVVIANAGIAKFLGSVLTTPEQELRDHYEINVIGPAVLFQATWPLLKASPKPIFGIVSSGVGSVATGATLPAGTFAYGASKAGANFLCMKLHSEHPELVVLAISPGPVQTDMSDFVKNEDPFIAANMKFINVETSVNGILKHILDPARNEKDGPKLTNYDGSVIPW
ncbi:NAD(P)-binding protein [Calocera viscosa TUFC12733]|uniref:NAD(P)-binding protein n=1 Tax=Calocera viscosa (strain TUFC12733) TaxID=1330018 RepID=A0A167I771_CALVF|nr:NAD(P)-binding protein [Calocera viscosa TUFC12733]